MRPMAFCGTPAPATTAAKTGSLAGTLVRPKASAEFVAHMEEVLETYAQPYDPACPVLCMDEQPVQLLKETRTPIPATAQHGKRVGYEYERAGTGNIFMFTEPLAGWREAAGRGAKAKP